jgi:hypothetical protein
MGARRRRPAILGAAHLRGENGMDLVKEREMDVCNESRRDRARSQPASVAFKHGHDPEKWIPSLVIH